MKGAPCHWSAQDVTNFLQMKYPILLISLRCLLIIFSFAKASSSAAAEAATDAVVHQIDAKTYQSTVLDSPDHWLVVYCGNDQNLDLFLQNISKKFSNYGISVGKIDCSKEIKICRTEGVRNIPSLKFFNGKSELNPYSGKHIKSSEMFSGETLDMNSIMKFISNGLPATLVTQISSSQELDAFIRSNTDLPTAVLFSDKTAVSLVFRSIAGLFKGRIRFLFVSIKSAPEIAEKYNVAKTSVGIFGINSAELTLYDGEDVSSRSAVVTWLNTFSAAIPSAVPPTATTTGEDSAHQHVYYSNDFKLDTLPVDSAWVVAVLAEGSIMPEEWTSAKKSCAGYVRSAILRCKKDDQLTSVDIDDKGDVAGGSLTSSFGQQVCKHVSPTVPSLLTLRYGEAERKKFSSTKMVWDSVLSEFNTYVKVLKKLGESLPATSVESIYEEILPQFVSKGYEKGMITVLLLSDGPSPPALFKNVALVHKDLMQFGFISGPSAKIVKSANNLKLPGVIALLPTAPDTATPAEGMAMRIVNYDHKALGPVKFDSLAMFIMAILRDAGVDQ